MTSDTMKVNWEQPLVVEGQDAELVGRHMGAYAVTWSAPNGEEDDKRFCIFDEGGAISRHSAHYNGGRDFRVSNKPAAAVGAEHAPEAPPAPAEAPLGVLTGVERLERLEALAARLAAFYNEGSGRDAEIAAYAILWMRDANEIVQQMAPPVDPDLLKAREIATEVHGSYDYTKGDCDNWPIVRAALAAIKAEREMGE